MPQNVSASVHQRLLNIAKQTERPFNELLQYYAMERFLYRLSQSEQVNSFILKGALLFRIWDTPDSRATRDIDVLGFTDTTPENLALACVACSLRKAARQTVTDPITGQECPVFNPRRHDWQAHFRLQGAEILGVTAIGRATVNALQMNRRHALTIRKEEQLRARLPRF